MADTCFVAMPFEPRYREYYDRIYVPAIRECDLIPVRADEIFSTGGFMTQVVNGIAASTITLADLTGRNANVFYEVGLAHAFQKPVIMLTQESRDIPADLQGLRWIEYATVSVDWAGDLRQAIVRMVRSWQNATPVQRMREFLPSAVVASGQSSRVAERIVDLSPTQRAIFDFISRSRQLVDQRAIEKEFSSRSAGELFYRLETLRLLGLLESMVIANEGNITPTYGYRLSAEAAAWKNNR